jgi:hypothetical protein
MASCRTIIPSALVAASLLVASSARAECITPGRWSLDEAHVELVFSGNVVGISQVADMGLRVTFDVERVWKGSVSKRLDLYVWLLDVEMPVFESGRRYVAFATKMTGRSRTGVGFPANHAPVFEPTSCGALDYEHAEKSGTVRDLGESKPPK